MSYGPRVFVFLYPPFSVSAVFSLRNRFLLKISFVLSKYNIFLLCRDSVLFYLALYLPELELYIELEGAKCSDCSGKSAPHLDFLENVYSTTVIHFEPKAISETLSAEVISWLLNILISTVSNLLGLLINLKQIFSPITEFNIIFR